MASDVHPPVLPDPMCLHLSHLETSPRRITAIVSTTALKAWCPLCQSASEHVHSRYVRQVADLPLMGGGKSSSICIHAASFASTRPVRAKFLLKGFPA